MSSTTWRSALVAWCISSTRDVAPHVDNTMTDTPTGPMTRSRANAMQDKVNSLLSLHQFNLSMDGLLPQADMLCVLRYESNVDPSMDKEAKEGGGPGDADREDTGRAAWQEEEISSGEVPGKPGTTGLAAVLPANCRKYSLLEVRQWPGSEPVLPTSRYYRPRGGTTGRRGMSRSGLVPYPLTYPHLPFVARLFIGSSPLRSRSD